MDATDLARRINDNLHWSRSGASELPKGKDRPLHLWQKIEFLWREPDETFAAGLYWLLLGRMGEAEGLALLCAAMAAGAKRADIVRAVALSDEAFQQKLDLSWLSHLDDPPPDPRRLSLAFARNALRRLAALRPKRIWVRVTKPFRRVAQ